MKARCRTCRMSKRYCWTVFAGQNHVPCIGRKVKWWGHSFTTRNFGTIWWWDVKKPETETVWQLHVHVGLNRLNLSKNIASANVCRRQAAGRFRPRHHHPAQPTRDWSLHSFTYNWLYTPHHLHPKCNQKWTWNHETRKFHKIIPWNGKRTSSSNLRCTIGYMFSS